MFNFKILIGILLLLGSGCAGIFLNFDPDMPVQVSGRLEMIQYFFMAFGILLTLFGLNI